jgi:putative ATP-binding cassette transporter
VLGNEWYGRFYDALQNKNAVAFWHEIGVFCWIAFFNIAVQVLKFYVTQLLQLRWRTWMTRNYLSRWMADRTFYHLELARYAGKDGQAPDNPDQRIQEDMQMFTSATMSLSMGLLNAVVTLLSFIGLLWALSGNFSFTAGGTTYQVVGAMVWVALGYSIVGTVVTHFVGRPLIGLNFKQQRYEADFRHHLVRVREYSEAIALDHGEKVERGQLDLRFGDVLRNYLQLIKQQKNLLTFTSFFGQAAVIFPFLVAAQQYFGGAFQLGHLMQIGSAFEKVQESLSWFVDNYDRVAIWRATTDRLTSFDDAMRAHANRTTPCSASRLPCCAPTTSLLRCPTARRCSRALRFRCCPATPCCCKAPRAAASRRCSARSRASGRSRADSGRCPTTRCSCRNAPTCPTANCATR